MERIDTDGRTFEAFCTDPTLWTDGSYLDHFLVMINGERLEDHSGEIRASDRITIFGGIVQHPDGMESLSEVFRLWLVREPRSRVA
jgi:hypothetical protein